MTESDFQKIDEYIINKLKKLNKKTSFDIYHKALRSLEELLKIDDDNETMHRIIKIVKFIDLSKDTYAFSRNT